MGVRSKQSVRCIRCRLHQDLCICPWVPRFDLATRLVLVMHRREQAKTTATGPLALLCLSNSQLSIHGVREAPLDLSALNVSDRRLLLMYPSEDSTVLTKDFLEQDPRPVTLVVPDGTWRQASTMRRRIPGLEAAERVRLPIGDKTRWGIRKEHREDGLATFEAIARALGIIESRSVQSGMEAIFDLMVKRTLAGRGR